MTSSLADAAGTGWQSLSPHDHIGSVACAMTRGPHGPQVMVDASCPCAQVLPVWAIGAGALVCRPHQTTKVSAMIFLPATVTLS
jgi:hypothetical protein